MLIKTKRLTIKPLTEEELKKYITDDYSLEISLELQLKERFVLDRIKHKIENQIIPHVVNNPEKALFNTFWIVIDTSQKCIVADICFKGEPNQQGETEIGYGTYPSHEGRGFMSEAVDGITNWALEQDDLKAVIAETDPDNFASQRILAKNNFKITKTTPDTIFWSKSKFTI